MKNSLIGWTTHTFNPVIGCTKVDEGCDHCYAETLNKRWRHGSNWGPGAPRQRTSAAYWRQPLQWNAEVTKLSSDPATFAEGERIAGRRPRVFCASLADWLDAEWPIDVLDDLTELIRRTQNLDWLLLTKRPQSFRSRIEQVITSYNGLPESTNQMRWLQDWLDGRPPTNVWVGTSISGQRSADLRVPALLKIPAKIRFLSCEPLLGRVDLRYSAFNGADSLSAMEGIGWVIVGGESGRGARPMETDWAIDLLNQCVIAKVPFFMKQMGGVQNKRHFLQELPEGLRVRQFPTS